jgi:hypothetical protein
VHFEIDFLESHDDASIVAELQRVAGKLGKQQLTAKEIDRHARINSRTVAVRFGSLRKALDAAGLTTSRFTKATDAELFQVLADLWTITLEKHARRPRTTDMERYGMPVSSKTIMVRFGTWKKALGATARAMEKVGSTKPEAAPPPEPVKRDVSVGKRFEVLKRDSYTCMICRKPGGELEVDHIIPVSRGGASTMDNLQTVCRDCNRGKGDRLM